MNPTALSESDLRRLPKVDLLIESEAFGPLVERFGRPAVLEEIRALLEAVRTAIRSGGASPIGDISEADFAAAVGKLLGRLFSANQCRVINATGVILHTSLGRAPLAPEAVEAAVREAAGYSLLELDRETGKRSDRDRLVSDLLARVTGAEAATVVNNNAAATMIILNTLAEGREVVCSRAHMVEIGGSYRMPDVMRKASCQLVEIGCTNKTRASDYEAAITERTGMLLKVHTSNYAIVGFTHEASLTELAEIGRRRGVPVIYDLGAGSLVDLSPFGITCEPTVQALLEEGADLVCFSGDKLFGGPQAGLIVGRTDLVARIKKNALFRMTRCDKITLSLLEHTLRLYLEPERVLERVPTLRAIARPLAGVKADAEELTARLEKAGLAASTHAAESQIGGGSTPGENLPTVAVTLAPKRLTPDQAAQALRMGTPSVFCRIEHDRLVFDPRTLLPGQLEELAEALLALNP